MAAIMLNHYYNMYVLIILSDNNTVMSCNINIPGVGIVWLVHTAASYPCWRGDPVRIKIKYHYKLSCLSNKILKKRKFVMQIIVRMISSNILNFILPISFMLTFVL